MEIRVITAQGLPQDVTEEELRDFVLLAPGDDGIKNINIERNKEEARAKIYFLDPKAADVALCFNEMPLRGQKVQIEEVEDPLEKELALLKSEIKSVSSEPSAMPSTLSATMQPEEQTTAPATAEAESSTPPSASLANAKEGGADGENGDEDGFEIIEEISLSPIPSGQPEGQKISPNAENAEAKSSALPATGPVPTAGEETDQNPKHVFQIKQKNSSRQKYKWITWVSAWVSLIVIILFVFFLTLRVREGQPRVNTDNTQRKLQQLDEQLKELKQLLDE